MEIGNQGNSILPPKYHVPDGEAHVMPDGKLYIHGASFRAQDVPCGER